MPELIERLVHGLDSTINGTYAIFGHSVGALIAFEFTRELRRRGKPLPAHLFVSGRRAAQCPPVAPIHHLNDRDFLVELSNRYGEVPGSVLADPEVLSIFLNIIRSDLRLMDTYIYREEPALAVPISAYGGELDRMLNLPMLQEWQVHTVSAFRMRMFDGGHFFPDLLRPQLLGAIIDDLGCMAT
jgi:surfactin synthase thioesterase subunit